MAGNQSKARLIFLDFIERAGWSAAQVFIATLLAGGAGAIVVGLPWKYAGVLAISAAVSSVILTAAQYVVRWTNVSFWSDLLIRLGKTFIGSIAASVATASVFNIATFNWTNALNVAAVATLTALGKGLLARGSGTPADLRPSPPAPLADVAPGGTGEPSAIPGSRRPADDATPRPNPSTLPTAAYVGAVTR